MKASRAVAGLPAAARQALAKLGGDLSVARRRRRISVQAMAERTFTSRATITRVERGDPRVSIAIYASVLFSLGLIDRLLEVAEPELDDEGGALDLDRLPQRIRGRRTTVRAPGPRDGR